MVIRRIKPLSLAKVLGVLYTARNWNTVRKLAELGRAAEVGQPG